jgi:hypothetical protein
VCADPGSTFMGLSLNPDGELEPGLGEPAQPAAV